MVIELSQVTEGDSQWAKSAAPEEIELAFTDYAFREPVIVRLSITKSESQYILKGHALTSARTRCVKCLEEFELAVNEEVGWAVQEISDPKLRDKQEDSDDFWFIDRGESRLEIGPRVRETIIISLPANPVCRPDCRGLCPRCGADLNSGPCGCEPTKTDGRWAPLGEILSRRPGSD